MSKKREILPAAGVRLRHWARRRGRLRLRLRLSGLPRIEEMIVSRRAASFRRHPARRHAETAQQSQQVNIGQPILRLVSLRLHSRQRVSLTGVSDCVFMRRRESLLGSARERRGL